MVPLTINCKQRLFFSFLSVYFMIQTFLERNNFKFTIFPVPVSPVLENQQCILACKLMTRIGWLSLTLSLPLSLPLFISLSLTDSHRLRLSVSFSFSFSPSSLKGRKTKERRIWLLIHHHFKINIVIHPFHKSINMAETLTLRGTLSGHKGWVTAIAPPLDPASDVLLSSSR